MVLDYSIDNKVKVDMQEYVKTIFNKLSKEFDGTSVTPEASHLFVVNDNVENYLKLKLIIFTTWLPNSFSCVNTADQIFEPLYHF